MCCSMLGREMKVALKTWIWPPHFPLSCARNVILIAPGPESAPSAWVPADRRATSAQEQEILPSLAEVVMELGVAEPDLLARLVVAPDARSWEGAMVAMAHAREVVLDVWLCQLSGRLALAAKPAGGATLRRSSRGRNSSNSSGTRWGSSIKQRALHPKEFPSASALPEISPD